MFQEQRNSAENIRIWITGTSMCCWNIEGGESPVGSPLLQQQTVLSEVPLETEICALLPRWQNPSTWFLLWMKQLTLPGPCGVATISDTESYHFEWAWAAKPTLVDMC